MNFAIKKPHTDAELVEGMRRRDPRLQRILYDRLYQYFSTHYQSLFFAPEDLRSEIFQNAFITLWEHIESQRITATDGQLTTRTGQPLQASLATYFMAVARYKYLETTRTTPLVDLPASLPTYDDDPEEARYEILADLVAQLPPRCYEILSKYYYEGKTLDIILQEIPTISTKTALKTKKYKCMETLRTSAHNMYQQYIKNA